MGTWETPVGLSRAFFGDFLWAANSGSGIWYDTMSSSGTHRIVASPRLDQSFPFLLVLFHNVEVELTC